MKSIQNTITERIKTLHSEIENALRQSLEKAFELGKLLSEVKEELPHGEFGKWVQDNLPFTDRTARNYMRLHERREELIEVGTIAEAYKLLATSAVKTETVSDLESDPVLIALDGLIDRAWHLQFSEALEDSWVWKKEKYEFTKWLKECWQKEDSAKGYLKAHLLEQLTPRSEKALDCSGFLNWNWVDSLSYSLLVIAHNLEQSTFEKTAKEYEETLIEIGAPAERLEKLRQSKAEGLLEMGWNYTTELQWNALHEDVKNLQTVFAAFHKRITGEVVTLAEAKKRAA